MALVTCHTCGEKISATADICPKCGVVNTNQNSGSRRIAFIGSILLLGAVVLVSYPYLFGNASAKPAENANIKADTVAVNENYSDVDTAREFKDSTPGGNQIPSNF